MNAKEFLIPGFECGKCKARFYFMHGDLREKAKQEAEKCCGVWTCKHCGKEVYPHWSACEDCQDILRLLKAKPVPLNCIDNVYEDGFPNEGFVDVQDLDDQLAAMTTPPAYVWATTFEPLHLNADQCMESALDGHWEDAQFDDPDEFRAFVERFNAKQKDGTFYPDYGRVVVLDEVRFADLLAQARAMEAAE